MKSLLTMSLGLLVLAVFSGNGAEDRRERVLKDREELQAGGKWVYNDFAKGVAEATRTRKPMLVVFRCIP